MMSTLAFELRDAARGLRRDRGFAVAVIVTLAVTLGATTATFSIVNGVLLKPLAFDQPDRLVTLRENWHEVMTRTQAFPVNERHFEFWRAHNQSFESMAQYLIMPATLASAGAASQIAAVRTSATLFDVLRVSPLLGRSLRIDDERDAAPEVAMISEGLWRRVFGARADIVGTPIVLDGKPVTIVGVWPESFRLPSGEQLLATVDVAIPLPLTAGWVGEHNNLALGRLKPGVPFERARAEIDVLQAQAGEIATKEAGERVTLSGVVEPLSESIVRRSRRSLLMLFGSVLSVLLIACANLTNLSLTRTLSQLRDAAVRAALGASRGRLLRQALLEHGLLGVAGGAIGMWIASLALRAFVRTAPIDLPRVEDAAIDGTVLMFGGVLTAITIVLVAMLPIWQLMKRDPQAVLRSGSSGAGQGPAAMKTRATLTAAQIALSVMLLTVTALLGASLMRVLRIEYGFTAERVLAVPVAMPVARYAEGARRVAAHDRILEAVQAIPGVRSVSSTSLLPMRGEGQVNFVVAAGTHPPQAQQPSANFRFVSPDYFAALQLPVLRGRSITFEDRAAGRAMPAVISESLARRLWPGDEALGKQFGRGIEGEANFEVVGIASDARTTSIERTPPLMVYVPYWWQPRAMTTLLVKSETDPVALVASIRRVVERIDPEIAIGESRPLDEVVAAALAGRRYQARLFMVFGVAALGIATLGVYAVAAYSVSKRRRELNIRVALGAATRDVMGLLMRQSLRTIAIGAVAGLAGALAAGQMTAGLLYEVQPRDPVILAAVAGAVSLVALAASLLAARTGLSINPVAALRDE
jgi:putative ABC transport system permease protein